MGCSFPTMNDQQNHASVVISIGDNAGMSKVPVSLRMEDRGVRLEVLEDLLGKLTKKNVEIARDLLGRVPSPGETVVHGLVKTIVKNKSYSEYLKNTSSSAHLVGKINVFVSHAWASSFKDTVNAIEVFEEQFPIGARNFFYFVDFLAVNQYDPMKDLDRLGEIVQRSEKLLVMITPWETPVALGRAWCVFELAHAVVGGTDIVIGMTAKEQEELKKAVQTRLRSSLELQTFLNIFARINSKTSKASVEADRLDIKKFIEDKLHGFHAVDMMVADSLRQCFGETVWSFCDEIDTNKPTVKDAKFLMGSRYLFEGVGMNKYGLTCVRKALDIYKALGDEEGEERAENDLAVTLYNLGRMSEAITLCEPALGKSIQKYGLSSRITLMRRYNLGVYYMMLKQWNKAEAHLRDTLKGRKEIDRAMSVDIRNTQAKLAEVLRDSGRDVDEAANLFKEMIDWAIPICGRQDPWTQLISADHARCLELKGSRVEAMKTYKKAYPIVYKNWGINSWFAKNIHSWIEAGCKMPEHKEE